jgi:CSLREA domain-containing protein
MDGGYSRRVSVYTAGDRHWGGIVAAALAILACALAVPSMASAALFTVDSTGDEADAAPNEICLTAGGKCTLRAAIEESNGSVGVFDEIVFEEEEFKGQAGDKISLGSSLPTIVDPVFINGKICATAAAVNGPCVGVGGPSGAPALIVEEADGVEIAGLAVTGAQPGIDVEESERFKVQGSWFGVELDGSAAGDSTGVFIGPGSSSSRIGGEGPEAGNVFANSVGDGLDIHGASNVKVLGDYFGVKPDGTTLAANGKHDIEVTSASSGEFEATGTTIGTRVSAAAVASPKCDGGCNLIAGAASNGIDLQGDGGAEAPAVATTIVGNYLGLNATGTAAVPNTSSAIHVGKAAQTVIGGPKAGDVNRINGGGVGVLAGPTATDLVVRGNAIGVDSTGTESLAPPALGIEVNSEGIAGPAVEAAIVDNVIGMEGGVAIAQKGPGARIDGNAIFGAEAGIKTFGSTAGRGNLIERNSIEAVEANGILVENDLNEILGNEVALALGAGIRIKGSPPNGAKGNVVGGNAAAAENVVDKSGGAAIEILNVEKKAVQNEVARNRGSGNGGLFIDLVAALPATEPKGPNSGIKPPGFLTAVQGSASGSAEPGARVRVFRKQTAAAGELESFLGEAVADGSGNWEVSYDSVIPAGTIVAATQTSEAGGTSELATATTAGEASGSSSGASGGSSSPPSSPPDQPPQTKIAKLKKKAHGSAQLKFSSNEAGSTFQCKLDGKSFKACRSPKTYSNLKPGKHVFAVRAIDPAGNVDPSPAKKKFTIDG